jgi:hypothetical protein
LVCHEWEKNPSRFSSVEKAGEHFADWLDNQGHSYEPRTVRDWIRAYANEKGVRLR